MFELLNYRCDVTLMHLRSEVLEGPCADLDGGTGPLKTPSMLNQTTDIIIGELSTDVNIFVISSSSFHVLGVSPTVA